jgi:hypothetical protein
MNTAGKGWRLAALAALVAGCGGGGGGGGAGVEPSRPTSASATSALEQTGVAFATVAQAPAIKVVDQRGAAVANVPVSFTVSGGGSVATPSTTTDASGMASAGTWTLGGTLGQQSVSATAGSLLPVKFITMVDPRTATTVSAVSAVTQAALAGAVVSAAPTVRVTDQTGAPMAGVPVTFAVTGGGTIETASVVTSAEGLASSSTWRLGSVPGPNTVTATVSGRAPVVFSATGTPRTPTALVPVSATSQNGFTAGSAVSPVVQVNDETGAPQPGVAVSFAVTGGGTLQSASAVTGLDGRASPGTWTLGPAAGLNTVTATVAGLGPVLFSATAAARVPTSMQGVSPGTQNGITGTAAPQAPVVRVRDQTGAPMAGVEVAFAVVQGGGSIQNATATTDAAGLATSGTWTLGPAAGPNTVTATATWLTGVVYFAATAGPRAATTVSAQSPTTQSAPAGTTVAQQPSVLVRDQAGQPMAGVQVIFAVTAGGGTLAGATATTNAAGIATVGSWTLGPAAGQNTVTATAGSLSPVTFTATGTAGGDPCSTSVPYTPGSTVSGALATTDCRLTSGEYVDFYNTTLSTAQALTFTMSSTAVDSWLELYDAAGNLLAFNDDAGTGITNSALRVFAPAGNYFLAATSLAANETGAYQLSSSALTGAANCAMYWVVPGVIIPGTVSTTDCNSEGYLSDVYLVVLRQGETLTVRMNSTAVDSYLGLYNASGNLVKEDDDSGGGDNALLTYTYSGTGTTAFFIDAGTYDRGEVGSYTLTVTRS